MYQYFHVPFFPKLYCGQQQHTSSYCIVYRFQNHFLSHSHEEAAKSNRGQLSYRLKFCIHYNPETMYSSSESIKMATLPSFFLFLNIVLLVAHTRTIAQFYCESTSCENGGISIQFPFWLRLPNQSPGCGYPGFDLSCTNTRGFSEPLMTLPESGDFVVKLISLEDQVVWINDPDECLPKRIMRNHGLNLEGSPFQLSTDYAVENYTFLRCPSNLTAFSMVQPITCLSSSSNNNNKNKNKNLNYSVVAMLSDLPFPTPWTSPCHVISWALIPVADMPWPFWTDYYSDIKLKWDNPNCGSCEAGGGRCGFLGPRPGDTAFRVGCYDLPSQGQGMYTVYMLHSLFTSLN